MNILILLFLVLALTLTSGGYFSGIALTPFLLYGLLPATLFSIAMIAINFWEITEWIERRSRR